MCSYFTRLFDRFASVAIQESILALTVRNPLLVLWRPNTAALRKVSIRIINASLTGKEEDDP